MDEKPLQPAFYLGFDFRTPGVTFTRDKVGSLSFGFSSTGITELIVPFIAELSQREVDMVPQ